MKERFEKGKNIEEITTISDLMKELENERA
jgi:hypothetical protein